MKHLILSILIISALTSCETPEQKISRHRATCNGMGFEWNSEAMANCVMQTENTEQQQIRRDKDSIIKSMESLNPPPPNAPVFCNSTVNTGVYGNNVNTICQ